MKNIHLHFTRAANFFKRLSGFSVPSTTLPTGSVFLVLSCLLFILCDRTASPVHAGTVTAWGDNTYGQTDVPTGLSNVVAVAAGYRHSMALRTDGNVVAWGDNSSGQTNVPAGSSNMVAVAGGGSHSLALRTDGTVTAWGANGNGQTDVPSGLSNVVAVAGGGYHSLALRVDGTVAAWGDNSSGQTDVPAGLNNVVAVAAGGEHSLALRDNGTVVAWGLNDFGQTNVPVGLSNVVAVACGSGHNLALRADGTVVAWGEGGYSSQTDVPAGLNNVVAVAAGWSHSLALRANGTVAAWGWYDYDGLIAVPPGLSNVVAVADGGYPGRGHGLALTGPVQPIIFRQPVSRTNNLGTTAIFSALASGSLPLNYRWQKDGVGLVDGGNISGAATATLRLINVLPGDAGGYSLVVSNAFGTSTSTVAELTAQQPGIASQPVSLIRSAGDSATFSVTAAGTPPFGYQWWKDGALLAGATSTPLNLTNLQGTEAGSYWVVVTNAFGAVTSSVALLSIAATLDTSFNPGAGGFSPSVASLAVQTDGKILVGGMFTTLGGQSCHFIGRLNANGTLDSGFDAGADWNVYSLAVQGDGKILVGGDFDTLGGQARYGIGRINANGTLDSGFNSGASADTWGSVYSIAVQADEKILVGGNFNTLSGQTRNYVGRLNADGTLDASFNPGTDGNVSSLAVQADGKILVGGGFTTLAGQSCAFIGRLNADGTQDTSFNPGADYNVNCIAVQADGKILVGGWFTRLGGQTRYYIARLHADGTLDPSFDPGSWSGQSQSVDSIAVQTDGKILVGGWFTAFGYHIGRLNTDGTLDPSFDPGADSYVRSLALQADGKILVGGEFSTLGGQPRNCIGRLNNSEAATQHLDYAESTLTWLRGGTSPEVWRTTFDYSLNGNDWITLGAGSRIPGGWQQTGVLLPIDASIRARGCAVGGQYFVETFAGHPFITTHPFSRTNNAGTTAEFSVLAVGTEPLAYQWYKDGVPLADVGSVSGARSAVLTLANVRVADAGGYSVVVSNAFGSSTGVVAVLTVRDPFIMNQPVSLDQTLGGIAIFNVTAAGTPPLAYQWWNDGALVVGATNETLILTNLQVTNLGSYWVVVTNVYGAVTSSVAMLSMNLATLDPTFNPGAGGIYPYVYSLAVQTDGKILVGGGFTTLGGQTRNRIGRLNADGTLDTSFNPGADYGVYSLGVQADGRILVGGNFTTLGGQTRNGIGRLNADGTLDTSFNPGVGTTYPYVYSLAVQADGKILVGGYFATLGGQMRSSIGRLNANGTLDTSFNPGAGGSSYPSVHSIALQADEKILVAGSFTALGGQSRNGIGRLNANGTLDPSFNPGAGGSDPYVYSLAVQADGKILVAGSFTTLGGQPRDGTARLNTDGTLDTSFNPTANSSVSSISVQADGKILVAGNFTALGGQSRNGIGRLDANGTLDPSFNPGTGGAYPYVSSLAVQADGKILVAGTFAALGGQPRNGIGRLNNTEPATQQLSCDGSTLTWLRGGTSPEVWWTTFDYSINGTDWIALGAGSRIPGGWQLTGASLPTGNTIRARGHVAGGGNNWFVESTAQVIPQAPLQFCCLSVSNGRFQMRLDGTPGTRVVVDTSLDLTTWTTWQTNTLPVGGLPLAMPMGTNRQFFRARIP